MLHHVIAAMGTPRRRAPRTERIRGLFHSHTHPMTAITTKNT
jgi:hypothetical protein